MNRRVVAVAGHTGDVATAERGLTDVDPGVRATALGALDRLGALDDARLATAFEDADAGVRRRAVELAATRPGVDLRRPLADADPAVVEVAAWACGEHEALPHDVLATIVDLASGRGAGADALVREAAVAALGAIGDDEGLDAVLAATSDRPAIRRRAVLALAAFVDLDHPRATEVAAALTRAVDDRDWQVRQAAEDVAAVAQSE